MFAFGRPMFPSRIAAFIARELLTTNEQKKAVFAALYDNEAPLKKLIDEEGCGPIFAAIMFNYH
jgi:hypothetical protein